MAASISDKITKTFNSVNPNVARVTATRTAGGSSLSCDNLAGWPTDTAVHFSTYQIDTANAVVSGTQIDWKGIVSGDTIGSLTRVAGATDAGSAVGDVVEMNPTGSYANDLAEHLLTEHNQDGTHGDVTATSLEVDSRTWEAMITGWLELVSATLSYTSWDSTNKTGVMATSADCTGVVSVGMKMRISQSTGGTKYLFVTAITSSAITGYFGTDYTLNNETVSNPYFSNQKAPLSFPLDPEKWTTEATNTVSSSQSSPTTNTWYNLGSMSLSVPIGSWEVKYETDASTVRQSTTAGIQTTLSTTNNSETDKKWTTRGEVGAGSNGTSSLITTQHQERSNPLTLTSATTYYLNYRTTQGASSITADGSVATTVIRAVCAFL